MSGVGMMCPNDYAVVTVRAATRDDLPWCLAQLRTFSAVYGTAHPLFPADTAHAEALLTTVITDHCCLIGTVDGTPVGLIAGMLAPHPYNPALTVLSELWWWVDPAGRGAGVGTALLTAFDLWGDAHADWVVCTLEAASPIPPEVLDRRGYRVHEVAYLREVIR